MATFSTGIKGQQPILAISSKFLACDPFPIKVMVGRVPGCCRRYQKPHKLLPHLFILHTSQLPGPFPSSEGPGTPRQRRCPTGLSTTTTTNSAISLQGTRAEKKPQNHGHHFLSSPPRPLFTDFSRTWTPNPAQDLTPVNCGAGASDREQGCCFLEKRCHPPGWFPL